MITVTVLVNDEHTAACFVLPDHRLGIGQWISVRTAPSCLCISWAPGALNHCDLPSLFLWVRLCGALCWWVRSLSCSIDACVIHYLWLLLVVTAHRECSAATPWICLWSDRIAILLSLDKCSCGHNRHWSMAGQQKGIKLCKVFFILLTDAYINMHIHI